MILTNTPSRPVEAPKARPPVSRAAITIFKLSAVIIAALSACQQQSTEVEQPKPSPASGRVPEPYTPRPGEEPQQIFADNNPYTRLVGHTDPGRDPFKASEATIIETQEKALRQQDMNPNDESYDPDLQRWYEQEEELALERAREITEQIGADEEYRRAHWGNQPSGTPEY